VHVLFSLLRSFLDVVIGVPVRIALTVMRIYRPVDVGFVVEKVTHGQVFL
jgi:hypothetical protein